MRKLSELNALEGLDVLVELTPFVKTLASDEALINEFVAVGNADESERSAAGFAAATLARFIPIWLKSCRNELMHIISLIDGTPFEAVEKWSPVAVFEAIGELFMDKDFITFFRSFVVLPPSK